MHRDLLDRIRSRLVAHGLSKRYVRRLLGELVDHFHSAYEHNLEHGMSAADAAKAAEAGLGDVDAIADDVMSRRELLPVVRRRPVMSFLSGPFLLVALAIGLFYLLECAVFVGATRLLGVERTDPALRCLFLGLYSVFVYAITPLLAAGFCIAALRCGCRLGWALCACGVLSAAGLVKTWLVLCPASGSIFFMSRFGIDFARLAAPLGVFFLILLARRLTRRSPSAVG